MVNGGAYVRVTGGIKDESVIREEESTADGGSPHVGYSSKAERLSVECQRPEYASPCKLGQKWHCVLKNNRLVWQLFFVGEV